MPLNPVELNGTGGNAIVISGSRGEALLHRNISANIINHVLIPNQVDLYVFVSLLDVSKFNISLFWTTYAPWIRGLVVQEEAEMNAEADWMRHHAHPNNTFHAMDYQHQLRLFHKFGRAMHLVEAVELTRAVAYRYVMYMRPDLKWGRDIIMDENEYNSDTLFTTVCNMCVHLGDLIAYSTCTRTRAHREEQHHKDNKLLQPCPTGEGTGMDSMTRLSWDHRASCK
jgi:hypothetical protein